MLPLPGKAFTSCQCCLYLKFQSHALTPEKFPALILSISWWRSVTIMWPGGMLVLIPLETFLVLGHTSSSFHVQSTI